MKLKKKLFLKPNLRMNQSCKVVIDTAPLSKQQTWWKKNWALSPITTSHAVNGKTLNAFLKYTTLL